MASDPGRPLVVVLNIGGDNEFLDGLAKVISEYVGRLDLSPTSAVPHDPEPGQDGYPGPHQPAWHDSATEAQYARNPARTDGQWKWDLQ